MKPGDDGFSHDGRCATRVMDRWLNTWHNKTCYPLRRVRKKASETQPDDWIWGPSLFMARASPLFGAGG